MEEVKEKTPQEQLNYFCDNCWTVDSPQLLYQALRESFISDLPKEKYAEMIPKLVAARKHYRDLVFLAEDLFKLLTPEEQKQIKFNGYSPDSLDEKVIAITTAEYLWRKSHNHPCKLYHQGGFCRPASVEDFLAVEAIMEMLMLSDSSALIMA